MKSKITTSEDEDVYPKLMLSKHHQVVVLLVSQYEGIVVWANNKDRIGEYKTTWAVEPCFEPFHGTVELSS